MSMLLEDFKKTKKELKYHSNQVNDMLEEIEDERDISNFSLIYFNDYEFRQKAKDDSKLENQNRRS